MKRKTLNTFLLFLLLCFILIGSFSFFYWSEYNDDLEALDYIGDPDWQKPHLLVSDVFRDNYSVTTHDNYFNLFYLQKNNENTRENLYITKNNFSGDTLNKNHFLESQSLNNFSVIKPKNSNLTHLFVVKGKDDSNQELVYYQLDQSNKIQRKKILLTDLSYTISLDAKEYNNQFYIGLTADRNTKYIIELFKYNVADNNIKRKTLEESSKGNTLGVRYPDLVFKDNKILLTYLREDPDQLFASSVDKTNTYQLCFQTLNLQLEPLNQRLILDRAFIRDHNSQPLIISESNQNQLNIFYHRYDPNNKQVYLNHSRLNLNNHSFSTKKIGNEIINSIDYTKNNKKYQIAYSKFKNISSHIYLYQNNKLDNINNSKKLFDYKLSSNPQLFNSENGLHLLWTEINKNNKDLYYSTNLYPREAGFFEILGINLSEGMSILLVAPIYLLALPILNVFTNTHIILFAGFIFSLIYYLVNKIRIMKIKNMLDNLYIAYILVMILIIGITPLISSYGTFFNPNIPSDQHIPIIFLAAFIAVLILLSKLNKMTDISPLLATGAAFLWLYWIAQINLVFSAHHYF